MSGRKFSMISPALWRPGRFLSLPDSDAQVLHLYFLTCDHQTSAGAFRVPDGYVCADLNWQLGRYQKARQALLKADLIAFDPECSTVYVKRWFRHCGAQTEKQAIGITRVIERIESDMIRELVEAEFEEAESERRASVNPLDRPPMAGSSRLSETGYLNGRGPR